MTPASSGRSSFLIPSSAIALLRSILHAASSSPSSASSQLVPIPDLPHYLAAFGTEGSTDAHAETPPSLVPKTSEFGLDRAVADVGSLRYRCWHAIEILQDESVAFRPYLSYRGALSHQIGIVGLVSSSSLIPVLLVFRAADEDGHQPRPGLVRQT